MRKAVYDANPNDPGTFVAAKLLLSSSTDSAVKKEILLAEANIMAGLDHPNIVKLVGVVSEGYPVLVVMEYCEHGELKEYVAVKDLSNETLMQFSHDCASGMAYLASRGIVHRDLAARNVLIDVQYHCKISDYGMSRVTNAEKTYYRSHGSNLPVRWTAPEALEQQIFSEQTDVWSYGILLHEIWSKGATPYEGMTERRVWVEVVGGYRLSCPPKCPAAVFAVMRDCWAGNGERPVFMMIVDRMSLIIERKQFAPIASVQTEIDVETKKQVVWTSDV